MISPSLALGVALGFWFLYLLMSMLVDALRFASYGFLKAKLQRERVESEKVDEILGKMDEYFEDSGRNLRELEWGVHLSFYGGLFFYLLFCHKAGDDFMSCLYQGSYAFLWITILGGLATRGISEPFAESILVRFYFFWKIWHGLMTPLTWLVHALQVLAQRVTGTEAEQEDEEVEQKMLDTMQDSSKAGVIDESEREMIENLIELKDLDVAEVMTPRTEMVAVKKETPLDQVVEEMVDGSFSRIMVYNENRDNVVGFIHVRDLLPYWKKNLAECPPLETLMHEVYYVPETKSIRSLFQEFKKEHLHIAVVLDEYGGTAGLISLEDILEEIVGEIVDEHQHDEEQLFTRISDEQVRVQGRMRVSELEELLEFEFEDDDSYDSIGGMLIAQLGRIPVSGETGEISGFPIQFRVLDANERRVEEVLFTVVMEREES